jgi:TM2 domain-containing membrane protein YozV
MRSTPIAYLLWCLCFVGACGIHRFYAGRWITGIIWLLTGGLLLIGQIIDLFLIPGMIDNRNRDERIDRAMHHRHAAHA